MPKKPINPLGLHKYIVPRLIYENETLSEFAEADVWLEAATKAFVFDCRSLSIEFVANTGQAAMEESFEIKRPWRLPFPNCYFEFTPELGVLAFGEDGIEFRLFAGFPIEEDENSTFGSGIHDGLIVYGDFEEDRDNQGFEWNYSRWHSESRKDELRVAMSAWLLTGVLTLLNEKLVAMEVKPDPAPALNKARAKKGLLPITSETRVLTINTAAVRNIAKKTPLKSHESPRLHWRRGHWRVLHRFSEFEKKVWVQRCLVGDPDLGYINKDYRLTWKQPMLA